MEILQTLIKALTTPNEQLINIIFIPLIFVEMTVTMLFFTTILNINATKKQKIIFVVLSSVINLLISYLIKSPIATILSCLLIIKFTFNIGILKSLVCSILPLIVITLCETIFIRVYTVLFGISYNDISLIPIYRISLISLIYIVFYLLYRLAKHFNFNISILDNMTKSLTVASVFGIIAIIIQMYLVNFYNDQLSVAITLLGTICSLVYFFISMYSLTRTAKLEITTQNLEVAQQYNKSLKVLHDNLRGFKHDFGNIVQAIGGYVATDDMEGLSVYYSQLLADCQKVNNLSALNPDIINNPAIYSIIASKYFKCDELGISINLDIFLDLNSLDVKIYELTRILGILLDNAIEAASECEEKTINIEFRRDPSVNRKLLIIENTYSNKDVNINDIFKKNYTSKPNHSGIGLSEVNQILRKNTNMSLFTTKNDKFFRQQLEIYDK